MSSEKLEEIYSQFGIEFKTNRRSFIFKHCPACGKSKNSVWMFRPDEGSLRHGGQCWTCGTKFSGYSYLVAMGYEKKEVRVALGIGQYSPDLDPESWRLPDFEVGESEALDESLVAHEAEIPAHYHKVWDWPNHPASVYARSRGLVGDLSRCAWIDPFANAVAFSITSQDKHVGFQKRFVDPNAWLKTKTDGSVPKARSFIRFGTVEQPLCVVEGPFDAVAACWFGYYGISTMGASISRTQAQEIAMMAFNQNPDSPLVHIGFDDDEAGERGSRYLARLLDAYGVNFCRVRPEKGFKDFNEALVSGGGLNLLEQEEFLNIHGLVREETDWHWSSETIDGFRYKIGIDYSWKDFRQDPTQRAKNRRKALNKLAKEDPKKYAEVMKKIEERSEKRNRRLELEGLT